MLVQEKRSIYLAIELIEGNLLRFVRARSCARIDDAKIVRCRDACMPVYVINTNLRYRRLLALCLCVMSTCVMPLRYVYLCYASALCLLALCLCVMSTCVMPLCVIPTCVVSLVLCLQALCRFTCTVCLFTLYLLRCAYLCYASSGHNGLLVFAFLRYAFTCVIPVCALTIHSMASRL